jgi:inner membrane protein
LPFLASIFPPLPATLSTPVEPITHFLFGATLSRAGFNRRTALATATMTLAAEAPDVDILGRFNGSVFGFEHHRGFTHSFLGVAMIAAMVVGLMYVIWRLRGRRTRDPNLPPRWALLFAYAYVAGMSHILLDFTNNYGVRPFWPFSERWYSWDIVFIIEPVLFAILILGLVLPSFFTLINEEIGARQKGPRGRFAAIVALLGVLLCWGFRDFEHRRAVALLESQSYQGADPLRVSAYPYMLNPFRWYAVVETPATFVMMNVDTLTSRIDPENAKRIRNKPEEAPVTLAAKNSHLGRVYLDWAKYPVTETEQVQMEDGSSGYIVRFRDLRYAYPGRGTPATLGALVFLDRELRVVGERFGARLAGSSAR